MMTNFIHLRLCNSNEVHKSNSDLYHKTIKSPFIRKCIARLRLDKANTFNSDIDKQCDQCNVLINSTHLLTECKKTSTERENFFHKMKMMFPSLLNMTKNNKCKTILNLAHRNDKILKDMCGYIKIICQKHCIV